MSGKELGFVVVRWVVDGVDGDGRFKRLGMSFSVAGSLKGACDCQLVGDDIVVFRVGCDVVVKERKDRRLLCRVFADAVQDGLLLLPTYAHVSQEWQHE